MSNFSFGTPNTTATAPTFGLPTQTQATGFGAGTTFGAPAVTATQPLSQPAVQSATPGLNFSFGSNAAAPTQIAQPGGLTLGGGGGTTTGLFPASTQAQPIGLGQPAQTTGLTFGTPAAKPAGLTFGTPATTATTGLAGGLSFGAPATTGGLTFGAGTAAATTGALSFGAAPTTGGLSFGTNTATPATTTSAPTATTGLTGGLSFGAPATTGGLTFGTSTAGATTGALSFGAAPTTGGLSFGTTTSTTASTSATPAINTSTLNFGATTTTSTSTLFGATTGGLFGAKSATTTAPTTTIPTTTNRGLGGLDVTVTSNKGLAQGNTTPTAAKENLLPNELMQTIDNFKEYVKTQKVLSSDIARGSARPLNRCAEDTASLMEMLTTLVGSVQRDRNTADKLKQDTAKVLQNAEIAQRTHDTPPGLQYENNAPLLFFMELADNFEQDLMTFKSQIENTEKHIQSMTSPQILTPQELTMAMSKLHESLVAVAGRLQGIHSKVQQQKEQYLNIRKYVLKDCTNVFEDISKLEGKSSRNSSIGKSTSGPTPFGPGNRSFLSSTSLNSVQTPSYGTNPVAWGNVTSTPSNNLSISSTMKPPTTGLNFNPPTNLTAPLSTDSSSNFQLQKPPVGNKRGKH